MISTRVGHIALHQLTVQPEDAKEATNTTSNEKNSDFARTKWKVGH
jgi:hypothetical protein